MQKEKTMAQINKKRIKQINWQTIGLPCAIIILSIVFGTLQPKFFAFENILNIGRQSAAIALIAWAGTMVIISGGIDLSVGSVIAFASVVMASVIKNAGLLQGILVALLIGTGFGFLNGLLIAKLNLPPFIVTLASMSIGRGAALTITKGTPIFGLDSEFLSWLGSGSLIGIPAIVLVSLLGFVLTYFILNYTKLGIYTYAIGGNEIAASWVGIPTARYKILIYTYAGLLVGVSAVLLTARVNSGQPLLATGLELQAIASVCIGGTSLMGGKGSLIGTFFGVMLVGILNNGLNLIGISSFVQQIIIGITILIAVLVGVLNKS